MAVTKYLIDTYFLRHLSADYADGRIAHIWCYHGNHLRGSLHFYKERATIPASGKTPQGALYLSFRESQLADMVATLRYERPLYLLYEDETHTACLSTSEEIIGEEETQERSG